MDFKKLSSSKIGDAIEAQWRADLAVDRLRIASGQKGSGLTSFLRLLDTIGTVFTIVVSLLIIVGIILYKCIGFFRALFVSVQKDPDPGSSSAVKTSVEYQDVTEVEEEEILQSIQNDHREITIEEWRELSSVLTQNGFHVKDQFPDFFLRDCGFIFSSDKEELILANWHLLQSDDKSWYIAWDSSFRIYHLSKADVLNLYELAKDPSDPEEWNSLIWKSLDEGVEVDYSSFEVEEKEFVDLIDYLK